MRALGTALLFGGALIGAFAAIMGIVGVAGNHAFRPQMWALVGSAGAVAIASLVVGVQLLRSPPRDRAS